MNTPTKQEALIAFNTIAEAFDDLESATLEMTVELARNGFGADRWQPFAEALDTLSDYLSRDS